MTWQAGTCPAPAEDAAAASAEPADLGGVPEIHQVTGSPPRSSHAGESRVSLFGRPPSR